jgi:type IV secretory pathway VirB10-like protein
LTAQAVGTAPGPQKLDPETFDLRTDPPAISRFRREIIIGFSAVLAIAVAIIGWTALSPAKYHASAPKLNESAPAQGNAQEVLAAAPADYSEVPRLGPPLPGDLGGPILRHQQESGDQPGEMSESHEQNAQLQAQLAEQQRLHNLELAAHASNLIVRSGSQEHGRRDIGNSILPEGAGVSASNAEIGKSDNVSDHGWSAPPSPWLLQAGSIIAASLITGLNSDLPGLVTAQVSQNVFDSISGKILLIPQGARLIGSYDSSVSYGQNRMLLVWQRIVFPDGSSIQIDNLPATDAQGYVGLKDQVDRHSLEVLKGIGLSSLMGIGPEFASGSTDSDLVKAVREALEDSGAGASQQLVQRGMSVKPTLKVRPGWPLRIVVHKDIILKPWSVKEASDD